MEASMVTLPLSQNMKDYSSREYRTILHGNMPLGNRPPLYQA